MVDSKAVANQVQYGSGIFCYARKERIAETRWNKTVKACHKDRDASLKGLQLPHLGQAEHQSN